MYGIAPRRNGQSPRRAPARALYGGRGTATIAAMDDPPTPPAGIRNLWAPWRIEYIRSLGGEEGGCFFCRYRDRPEQDADNLVLWRGAHSFAVLNRFPYTGGHALVAPFAHRPDLEALDAATVQELFALTRDTKRVLERALGADGFNVGLNLGRCAGAGLPGHLHVHIVPRWEGDTNFVSILGDVRVIPQTLGELRAELLATAAEMHLPDLPAGPDRT